MKVTLYIRPNGKTKELEIQNILPEDEAYFNQHGIRIGMEDIGDMFAVYATLDIKDDEGGNVEILELSQGRSCEETLSALRKYCEEELDASKTNQETSV